MPDNVIQFETQALGPDVLLVDSFKGEERLSRLYRFEISLVSRKDDIDFDKVLNQRASLGLKAPVRLLGGGKGSKLSRIGGIVSEFEQDEKHHDFASYRAVLVPALWRLTLTVQSQVFLEKTVIQILEEVLKANGFTSKDYELRTSVTYPTQEFVVQYQESDFDFISRWLESEGIFYSFQQTDEGEKVIFGDSTSAYLPLPGAKKVLYSPTGAAVSRMEEEGDAPWFKEERILSLSTSQMVIPKEVILKDYNYRRPSEDLKCSKEVGSRGHGKLYSFADHFKDQTQGNRLAAVRSEEIKCRQKVFRGTGDHKSFHPGASFQLEGHYRGDFNTGHLIIEVHHEGEQELGLPGSSVAGSAYRTTFASIPSSELFRPERATTWPSIHGVINAKIDGGGSGQYAEVDDEGRYKVKLPFDLSEIKDGKASRYIRMAQPYSGEGMGMHFPLHKGTEVLLTFVDGDPDRPIIASSVPNPETGSPVKGGNSTQCAIHTGGGNKIVIEDSAGGQQIRLSSPTKNSFISLGAMNPPGNLHIGTEGDAAVDTTGNSTTTTQGNETRNTTGTSFWSVKGFHSEKYLGAKEELVVGAKTEQTLGLHSETIVGAKLETVLAIIVEAGLAARMDKVTGPHIFQNSLHRTTVKTISSLTAGAAINQKAPKVTTVGTAQVFVKSGGTSMTLVPGSATMKSEKVAVDGSGSVGVNGGKIAVISKGALGMKAANMGIKSEGNYTLTSDGPMKMKGSEITMKSATISLNGSTVKVTDGAVKINGNELTVG